MFTNQKLLGVLLILFIIGAGVYLTVSKFKQDISSIQASPSPSPSDLSFIFNKSDKPAGTGAPQATELPLSRNKKLSQFPGVLKPEVLQNEAGKPTKKAIIQTNKGIIQLKIYPEASMAASNFILLAANGFYDGLKFHRVESGFVIQGGDPLGDGTGGPGYQFPDEKVLGDYVKGVVAMANSGPDTNGSQFFIMLEDHPELPKKYTIFGAVIAGMDVVEKIAVGDIMQKIVIQNLQ